MPRDSDEIRGFVAIELPKTVKTYLAEISADLKRCRADVKWVRPEAMHLTLKFLGNVRGEVIPAIENELRSVLAGEAAMHMQVTGLGAFPGLNKPRVIWAGLKDVSGKMAPLAAEIDKALEPLGFEREKRSFSPHLTLGRVRSNSGIRDLVEAVRTQMDAAGPTFIADRILFFESILKPSGAEYYPLCSFALPARQGD
jgi:RNA 2',3'-cyclic 3'-phosphodiesterase